jgi:hypothetical protein
LICSKEMKSATTLLFLAITLAFLGSAAGCDYWDQLEFRNRTSDELVLKLSLSVAYDAFDCEDGHLAFPYAKDLNVTLLAGKNICHTGPITGRSYNALDDIDYLTISRLGSVCIDANGAAVRPWFVREDERHVLAIDDARCPSVVAP